MTGLRRWGRGLFLLALAILPAGILLVYRFPPESAEGFYRSGIPAATALFAFMVLTGILFAYPRVRNLHLLVPGGLVCVTALASSAGGFGLFQSLHRFEVWLPLMLQLSLVPAMLLPALARPATVIRLALAFWLLFTAALFLPFLTEKPEFLLRRLSAAPPQMVLAMAVALLLAALSLTLIRLRDEFSLGGMTAGISFLSGLAWITALPGGASGLSMVYIAAIPLYTGTGTLIHWLMRLEHRALYDPLLQIYNRGFCESVLDGGGPLPTAPPFTIALFDLDHFKKINDSFGHQAGDAVLFAAAGALQKELIPSGTVCRYGGEEIIAFFPGRSGREVLADLERCRKRIAALKIPSDGQQIHVTVSCGAGERCDRGESPREALKRADSALYRAKNKGRNRVELEEESGRKAAGTPAHKGKTRPRKTARPK
jgi:diguanylate cyclase (GGDEF)-like protein